MADIRTAVQFSLDREGVYSNDANDRGQLTVYGISRYFNPDADIWPLVDALPHPLTTSAIKSNPAILDAAISFYEEKFCKPLRIAEIVNQDVANDTLRQGINGGLHTAIVQMQQALGLPETGVFDNATLNILNSVNNYA